MKSLRATVRKCNQKIMAKRLLICMMLLTFAPGSADAYHQEAVLQTIQVPGAGFDLVVATPRPDAPPVDLAESPDALVVYLIGGELALLFDKEEKMFEILDWRPASTFHVEKKVGKLRIPVAIYIVPKPE